MWRELKKINIGCGTDYREGFINIDGSNTFKTDMVIDIAAESLRDVFSECSIDHVLANDIIEHHFHWEAVRILRDLHHILAFGGTCEIRVPDSEYIIENRNLPIALKLNLLFGGQDIPQR